MIITIDFGFVLAQPWVYFLCLLPKRTPCQLIDNRYLDCRDAETKIGETDLDLNLANRNFKHLFV